MPVLDNIQSILDDESVEGWDRGFLESVQDHLKKGRKLTEKQEKALEKVFARHTKEAKQERADWFTNFGEAKRERLRVIADYYLRVGSYFMDLVANVKHDENFVPTKKQYHAMCENKYSEKIWENYKTPAKFQRGDLIMIRKVQRLSESWRGKVCVVLDNNSNRFEPFKGGRPYDVFVPELGKKLQLHERDVMRKR
jgi:hypothetical protein